MTNAFARRTCLFALLLGGIALAAQARRPAPVAGLKGGASNWRPIPFIDTDSTTQEIALAPHARTLLVLVDSRCGHCEYQLTQLATHIHQLQSTRVYVVTTEGLPAVRELARRWPAAKRMRVRWGQVSAADAHAVFGTRATPVALIYSSDGKQVARFIGETSVKYLLAAAAPPHDFETGSTGAPIAPELMHPGPSSP